MFQTAFLVILFFPLLMTGQVDKKKAAEMFKPNNVFISRVKAVPQGDQISIKINNKLISVRLAEIDSPDPRQPFSKQAQQFTEDLTLGQTIQVKVRFVDRYRRVIGEIRLKDGRILNHEIIRWGYAWHYRVSTEPNLILDHLEYEAWKKRLGLWVLESPVPPWKFRAEPRSPEPPPSYIKVDYDRIFEYGLFGNQNTRFYSWPACTKYRIPPKKSRIIFSNKYEAESLGYRTAPHCLD
tara:strand:+ start:254 stop:967 length:714 start_codon:yes stop_codon:yes gene_type:complete